MPPSTSSLAQERGGGARRAADPLSWYWPRITFVSTCPRCGQNRVQHGYTRHTLLNLLNARCKIDAYCIVCNVCWPISERERREIPR